MAPTPGLYTGSTNATLLLVATVAYSCGVVLGSPKLGILKGLCTFIISKEKSHEKAEAKGHH